MKKRMLACSLLAVAMSCAFCACGGETNTDTTDVGDIVTVNGMLSTEKYLRDAEVNLGTEARLDFVGIRNEVQSAQLLLTAKERVTSFNLEAKDLVLTSDSTKKIGKDAVSVFAERYVEIYDPYISSSLYISEAGFYPDALVPIDKYRTRLEDRITKGETQAIWVDVDIAKDASPGTYTSAFSLTVNGMSMDIPVSLKVYDLELPDEVHNASMFEVWYQNTGNGEGANMDDKTNERYFEYMWEKRVNCSTVPPEYTTSMDLYVNYIETLWNNPKVTMYQIPWRGYVDINQDKIWPTANPDTYEQEQAIVRSGLEKQMGLVIEHNLKLRKAGNAEADLLKKAVFYYEDEPVIGQRGDCVKIFCRLLEEAKNNLAQTYATQFEEYPDLRESLMGIKEMCPSWDFDMLSAPNKPGTPEGEYNPDYSQGGMQLWCPDAYWLDYEYFRDKVNTHLEAGEEVWWYVCVSNTPKPSYYAESLPVNMRLMNWMQYDYKLTGFLYWCVNYYAADRDNYNDIQYPAFGADGVYFGGGEGILLYPGVRYGMKEPISSWRFEQIRLGQQDYELFWMLDQYLQKSDINVSAHDIVNQLGKTMYVGTTVSEGCSSAVLENARIKLLDILEKFAKEDVDGAKTLINQIIGG